MIVLRDMRESDIEDYVRWFTREIGWMDTDAPWEDRETSEEEERRNWREYFESVKELPEEETRWKLEIEYNGKHIGWVSRYFDLEYLENPDHIPAIGIDMPEQAFQNQGIGTEALRQFMEYLKGKGHRHFYIQTWSGNERMLRVAGKLGFSLLFRKKDHRLVEGKIYDALTLMI